MACTAPALPCGWQAGPTPEAVMRPLAGPVLGAVLSALLAGCASIEPERCTSVDWHAQGLADGRNGFGPRQLARHRDACAKVGVQPGAAAWEAGRQLGLAEYCQLPNALTQGLARHGYDNVCPDPRFAQLYGAARRLADARHQVGYLDGQIDWRERELLTNKKLADARRAELAAEVRSLQRQRERAIADGADAAAALDSTRRLLGF